mgnify:FL=1|tara:strand:+ start:203 stop:2734 length:2532 start_codon:yes stop_codon:yes gene_type:complete
MAILPRYQRIGLKTRQPQQLDFADTREQARLGQNISQQVNRMADFAFKQASTEATARGERRVRDEGALPTLASIDSEGGPQGIEERAAYALGSRVAAAELQSNAEVDIMRIMNEGEQNETPFSVIQQQLLEVSDGYSASLADMDPAAGAVLKVNLEGATAKATERYSNYYVKLQANNQNEKIIASADLQSQNIIANAILPGANANSISADIQKSIELLEDLGAEADTIEEFRTKSLEAATKENTVYKFNTSSLEQKESMLSKMETKPVAGMTLSATQNLRKFLRADYNSALSVSRAEATALLSDIREAERVLALGGMPSEKQILSLSASARSLGDLGSGARDAIRNLEFNMEKASTYRKMSPEELVAEVSSLKDGMPGLGAAGVDTLLEAETLQVANAYLSAANTNAKNMAAIEKAAAQPKIDILNASIKSFQALTNAGLEVPPEDFAALAESIGNLPDVLTQDLKTDFELLTLDSDFVNKVRESTPFEISEYITLLKKGGVQSDELRNLTLAEKMLSNMQSELSKDPLAFSMNRGLTDSNNNKIELNQLNLTGDSVELSASIKERINYSNIVANRYNIEPKFFTEQEKNSLVETLRTADRATQMYLLGGIVDGGGQNAPDMLAEISGSSPEFAGIGALVNAGNMSVASSALSGFEALSSGFKPLDFTATNTDRPFNALTSVALRYLPNSSEISRTVATAIYADIARFEDTFSESLWNQAINQSLGGSVKAGESFGGIQEVRGQKTLVPSNLTPDIIEAALKNITPESLAFASGGQIVDAGLVKDISGMGMFVADSNYTIVSRGGDDFAITLGDADKLNPLFVSDVNDNPIQFNIQKLVEALQ